LFTVSFVNVLKLLDNLADMFTSILFSYLVVVIWKQSGSLLNTDFNSNENFL
jgi:hypothetical protein